MKARRSLFAVLVGLGCCAVLVALSAGTAGSEVIYEVRPQIDVPQYPSHATSTIDAYERLMDRYMDLTGSNLVRVGTDLQSVINKLDSIDRKLTRLSARMGRIEKSLGLEPPAPIAVKKPQPETARKSPPDKP
ncbi:MAG: hypothetical protein ACYST6_16755 [Planctomycetota bacterium]|jgi:hypothetical protein